MSEGEGKGRDEALAETVTAASPDESLSADMASLASLLALVAATPGEVPTGVELPPGPFADGGFEIERKLGAGGMGVVYLARDTQLDRAVAIKLARTRGGEQELDRMRREATAMGRLTHPNVVRVYEAGTTGDQLFIVMEYMSGGTLRHWLRDGERPLDAILDVFTRVGEGLAAAHAAGIAHRDFKPDNVFMDEEGKPAVADFGLARAVGDAALDSASGSRPASSGSFDSRLTATGATLGTPRYMAPEQFDGGDVDARADQFSFCVALYEAVYDQHPFGGDSMGELRQRVRTGQVLPPRPDRSVPAWLRKILARGLAVDPDARFPDMRALLGQLAAARARSGTSVRYVAAGLLALALVGGGVLLLRGGSAPPCSDSAEHMAGVWDDEARARVTVGFDGTGLAHAAAVRAALESRLDAYRDRWVAAHTQACTATRVRKERSEAALDLSMSCLERQRAQLGKLAELFTEPDRALVAGAVDAADSLPSPEACHDVSRLGGSGPGGPVVETPAVIAVRARIGVLDALVSAGRYEAAGPLAEELVVEARALEHRPLLADTLYDLGLVRRHRGQQGKPSIVAIEEALNVAYASGYDSMVAKATTELALIAGSADRVDDADRWFQMGLAAIERLGGDTRLESSLRCAYVNALGSAGKFDQAIAQADRCLALTLEHSGPNHRNTVIALHNVGLARIQAGDYAGASEAVERALAVLDESHSSFMRLHAGLLLIAAGADMRQGKLESAEAHARRALESNITMLGADAVQVGDAHDVLASILGQRGRAADALEHMERSADIDRLHMDPDSTKLARTLGNLAIANAQAGKLPRAVELSRESLAALERAYPEGNHADLVNAHAMLGTLLRYGGDAEASLASLERSVELAEEAYPPGHPQKVNPMIELGHTLAALGQHGQAIVVLERAVELSAAPNVPPPWVAEGKFALAGSLRASGRGAARARRLASEARTIYSDLGKGFAPQVAEIDGWLKKK